MSSSSSLSVEMEKDVLPWLKIAEDLRGLSLESELNVPQICVMGDQSSGKSSVLNLLAGDIIFPSGTGLVTRCAIRLVMRKARAGEEWSAFVSTSITPKRIEAPDVESLYQLIGIATTSLCQGTSNFSTEAVIVDLLSPDACDLTVVDLPGIIRTVTTGQNASVIGDVNQLITSYLKDKRTIILAVIPANQDIATVDILERAQSVDPLGERTIGVFTKIDLINPGGEEEVLAVVNNIRKPLALGYIMVKNRSQLDLNHNMTTTQARESEVQFFRGHSVFGTCDPHVWGVDQLAKKLSSLLVTRIQMQLVPMRIHVEKHLGNVRAELRSLISFGCTTDTIDRQKLLISVTQEYVRHLTDTVRGEYRDRIMVKHVNLRLYTLVLKTFEDFQVKVNTTAPPFKNPTFVHTLAEQIEQLRGRELPGFMSSQAFYMSMSQYVDAWSAPMQSMIASVRAIAHEVAGKLSDVLLQQYPSLRETIRVVASRVLNAAVEEATLKLMEILAREKDPFTMNDFLQQRVNKLKFERFNEAVDVCFEMTKIPASNWSGLKDEVYANMKEWYRSTHSVTALASAQDMCAILEAYWHLSSKRFIDISCMLVDKEILGTLASSMQEQMFVFVRDDSKLEFFFTEDPLLVQQRRALESRRDRLTMASSALGRIQVKPTTDISPIGGTTNALKRLTIIVDIGVHGIGLIIADDDSSKQLIVKDLRKLPDNVPNPSELAGVKIGDRLERINGEAPANLQEAFTMLKNSKRSATLTILRK